MAAFLNEDFGITGGFSGAGKTNITTDGGETWDLKEESGGCLYGLDPVNENTIWVAGRKVGASFTTPGGVRLVTNSGTEWQAPSEFPFSPLSSINPT